MQLIARLVSGLSLTAFSMILTSSILLADVSQYSGEYPGLTAKGGVVNVADSHVLNAVLAFQLVYGRNPASWSEITDCGLFDGDLYGYRMERIDPDDSGIEFKGDIQLHAESQTGEGNEVRLYTYWNRNVPNVGEPTVELGESYADLLEETVASLDLTGDQLAIIESWKGNESQLIQFGQIRQLAYSILLFQAVRGEYPASLVQLIESGLAPLSLDSINPMTGQTYGFDGSRGDLLYELVHEGRGFKLSHVDLQFDPEFEFSY